MKKGLLVSMAALAIAIAAATVAFVAYFRNRGANGLEAYDDFYDEFNLDDDLSEEEAAPVQEAEPEEKPED